MFADMNQAASGIIDIVNRLAIDDGFHALEISVIAVITSGRADAIGRARDDKRLIGPVINKGQITEGRNIAPVVIGDGPRPRRACINTLVKAVADRVIIQGHSPAAELFLAEVTQAVSEC